jgi:NAD(P)-dependent dehydrogenase (short-subunit alcohol dehydrogenase family)
MIPAITSMKGAFDLTGKNAIVTGGNGGIGLGIATAMAQSGANVAILCRNMQKAENALKELNSIGGKYEAFPCDVTDLNSVRKAVAAVYESFGQIDILVNNAGVATNAPFLEMDDELSEYYRVIATDLNGMVNMTFEVAKRMAKAGKGGSIVNITSNAGVMVNKGMHIWPYSTAKAGANHFTHCMAVELGPHDITVNAIAPGFIRAGLTANPPPEMVKMITDQQPLDRLGEALEVGALAVFLASPAAASITGTVNLIDGGYVLSC